MGEPHIRMKAETVEGETWRRTGGLRWARPPHTTTKPDRLQEAWQSLRTGHIDWRDIPVAIVDDNPGAHPMTTPESGWEPSEMVTARRPAIVEEAFFAVARCLQFMESEITSAGDWDDAHEHRVEAARLGLWTIDRALRAALGAGQME